MIIDNNIAITLVNTLNNYAALYKSGNTSVLPAIHRIVEALKNNNYEITATATGYKINLK